ncbi:MULTISPECIES: hypothetical protein [Bacillus]|jgi:hypothetical protein|uniref:Uncharacterized protein n=1 Tax=Bacillus cereus (strain G9842) TaxID=405531 RepID=B7IZQ2_BACC2|nr:MULTISPECIES: hypothetical protein [Bacillus]MBS9805859.1 hypothetical protein [Bacillus toyonensis]ACK98713.1 hypothetical protein BCG9842_A0059 [Bacillus cereus G9842]KUF34407.1 hypothetical protein AMR94_02075 [Bacillus sp. G3(2015)]MCU5511310.1 hypothetical protein [Bacillus cereus]MDA1951630.1 hypothetical protein [Bacillus cereus]
MKQILQEIKKVPIEIYPFFEAPNRYKSLSLMDGNEQFIIIGTKGYSDQVESIAKNVGFTYQMIQFNGADQNELKSIAITYYK